MADRRHAPEEGPRVSRGALFALFASALAACPKDEPAPVRQPPPPPPAAPAIAPAPVGKPGPTGLRPADKPVMGAAVPEGFVREETAAGLDPSRVPWVNLTGDAPLDAVLEFYERYLDPGIPFSGSGTTAMAGDGSGRKVPCKVAAARPRPGCTGPASECVERVCLEEHTGAYQFRGQHPLPPGEPAATVNVRVGRIGSKTRITIENQSILARLREHPPPEGFPERPDLGRYERLEDIPSEYID